MGPGVLLSQEVPASLSCLGDALLHLCRHAVGCCVEAALAVGPGVLFTQEVPACLSSLGDALLHLCTHAMGCCVEAEGVHYMNAISVLRASP